jgi:hypothetical protein
VISDCSVCLMVCVVCLKFVLGVCHLYSVCVKFGVYCVCVCVWCFWFVCVVLLFVVCVYVSGMYVHVCSVHACL